MPSERDAVPVDCEEEMVASVVPMIHRLAREVARKWTYQVSEEDLVGVGLHAALLAARRYDPDRGAKFSTFAFKVIRTYQQDYVRRSWISFSGLTHQREERPVVQSVLSLDVVCKLEHRERNPVRMIDIIPAPPGEWAEERADLHRAMEGLPDREREVLSRWSNGETFESIGRRFGFTHSWAHWLVNKTLASLREKWGDDARAA